MPLSSIQDSNLSQGPEICPPRQIKTTQNKVKVKNYLPWTEYTRHRK